MDQQHSTIKKKRENGAKINRFKNLHKILKSLLSATSVDEAIASASTNASLVIEHIVPAYQLVS